MTQLHQDWHARLQALLMRRHDCPFAWGQADCCTWAADCWQAMTDTDPLGPLRGTYATRRQARHLLRQCGGLAAALGARLGAPQAAGMPIMPGSIVLAQQGRRQVMGLAWPAGLIGIGSDGLVVLDSAAPLLAWRPA